MNILVTGSKGYIGGRLCEHLQQHSRHRVLRGTRLAERDDEIITDWSSSLALEDACTGMDAIVHLAALNAANCASDPALAVEVNCVYTERLLQAARRRGVRRFVYLSTAHLYGAMLGTLKEDSPLKADHPYATSHRAAEDAVMAASTGDMSGVILRLSNAYGPPVRQDVDCWMLLMNDLCRQAMLTGTMRLHGNGMQRRDFITMSDACRAIQHVLEIPVGQYAIYNLGGNWSPTVLEVAQWIARRYRSVFGKEPNLVRPVTTGTPDPALNYCCSALAETGFVAEDNREAELDALLMYCKKAFLEDS